MIRGLKNIITRQIGEHSVCGQLGKLGYIATTFSGNVPEFDIIIADEHQNTIPIQVKATNGDSWKAKNANFWMKIEIDEKNKSQKDHGNKEIDNPKLIYVCVAISNIKDNKLDRYFVINQRNLQNICAENYRKNMNKRGWKRPKNYKSMDTRYNIEDLKEYEDNWKLIKEMIGNK